MLWADGAGGDTVAISFCPVTRLNVPGCMFVLTTFGPVCGFFDEQTDQLTG